MTIYALGTATPQIDASAYVAESATVIGSVTLKPRSSVWFGAVLRADNVPIEIGEDTNVQDGAVLHGDPGYPLVVGNGVTIAHQAMLHGCTIGDGSLIGVQAVILNGVRIGRNCLVGAGAVVTEGKEFPDNSLIVGTPGKAIRDVTPEAIAFIRQNALEYIERSERYKSSLRLVE